MNITETIAAEFGISRQQIDAVVGMLDEGKTIPFIARYRKEATGALDDQVLQEIAERLEYLRGLEKRRAEIEKKLTELDILNDELQKQLGSVRTLTELEDIYRPYKPKRRTRASVAREKGLEPLADWISIQYLVGDPFVKAREFVNDTVADAEEALAGARDIIAETISDDAELRKLLRSAVLNRASVTCSAAKDEDSVYSMYYGSNDSVEHIAPHRILAVNRGEREGFLKVVLKTDDERAIEIIRRRYVRGKGLLSEQVGMACEDSWSRLLCPSLENEQRTELTTRANDASIKVFADNLHQLLLQPPVRGRVILGVDPGFRTGCKLAVIDAAGCVLETGVGYFTLPGFDVQRAEKQVRGMIERHEVTAIAIGNGTAGRESERFIAGLIRDMPGVQYAIVNEAGASVYSAGKAAAKEFPNYDVTLRSAISIARRLQDPLAELIKIDPKAIGVGQYQHDLKQNELSAALDNVVMQCVNKVGVDIETASVELLSYVSGIGPVLAKNIIAYRDENGIHSRVELKKVPKLGPRAFEQCAGFIRVRNSKNPLDGTAVHPESYSAAGKLMILLGKDSGELKNGGIPDIYQAAEEYGIDKLSDVLGIGIPTLKDILTELAKPGRDPRDDLPASLLRTDVLEMGDLKPGMELTGTVRNVIDFGAFIDIGVHQDGLVHISKMSKQFIKHPSQVVRVGELVKVWVVDVDEKRKRIALTMIKPE